jgi:hypothetical protein
MSRPIFVDQDLIAIDPDPVTPTTRMPAALAAASA